MASAAPQPAGGTSSVQTGSSTFATPDTLRNGQSSSFDDYGLSTDWTPQTDNVTAGSDSVHLCGRPQLYTIGPTVDLPANMQEGKRRSLRSQAAPPGAAAVNGMVGGVAEHSGVYRVPGLESLHSLSSRSSTASPTPTVGTAIGSHGATSPASEVVAPQQRLRRPMNSFLLYSNDHRKPGC